MTDPAPHGRSPWPARWARALEVASRAAVVAAALHAAVADAASARETRPGGIAVATRAGAAATPRRIPAPPGAPAPPPSSPDGSALREPRAGIDWTRRVLRCDGVAPPTLAEETENVAVTRLRTERAARDAAARACVDALRTVVVEEGLTAGALLAGDARLQHDLERVIRRGPVVDAPRLFSDGGAAVRLAVPLDGPISDLLFAAADRVRARPRP